MMPARLIDASDLPKRLRPVRVRPARTRRHGFTLIEMMVALTIGAMVIASVYTIGASASRHFQEQQRVSQLQLSVRLALDRIRRDAARAGYHGTMNSAIDTPCGPAPGGPLFPVRGVRVTDRSAATTAALGTMTGWTAAASHGDRLEISGNFRTGDSFVVREWEGTSLELGTNFLGYRRTFSADPTTNNIDTALVAQTFAPGTPLVVRLGGGMRIWTSVGSVTADSLGTNARITTVGVRPVCPNGVGMEGWAQGGVTVAPVSVVRYEIVVAPPELAPRVVATVGTNTVLMRTELNPLTGAVIDGPTPILEYAVHFDVDVFQNSALPPAPALIQLRDDVAATVITTGQPQTVRGLRISLAARTTEADPRLSQGVAPLADGTPRVFRVFALGNASARVRSAYTEVFLPNANLAP